MTTDALPADAVHPPVTDDEAEAVLTACRVLVAVSAQSIAAAESVVDLTELRILVILATFGPTTLADMADMAEVHPAAARRLCERLASVRFVTLDDHDSGSRPMVALTAQGQGVVHMVTSRRRAAIEPVLKQLSSAGRAELVTALREFTRAAGEPSLRDLWAMGWTQ